MTVLADLAGLGGDPVMGVAEFRRLLHLSVSAERRMRTEEPDWPPHVVIGRKVFYFRTSVRDFLARRLATQVGVDPDLVAAARGGGDALEVLLWALSAVQDRRLQQSTGPEPAGDGDPVWGEAVDLDLDTASGRGEGDE